jgi:hypothetical protein
LADGGQLPCRRVTQENTYGSHICNLKELKLKLSTIVGIDLRMVENVSAFLTAKSVLM